MLLAVGVTFVGTAMTFLMWLHRLVALTRVISSGIEWTPLTARAEERLRRIRESPPEALEAEGIPLR